MQKEKSIKTMCNLCSNPIEEFLSLLISETAGLFVTTSKWKITRSHQSVNTAQRTYAMIHISILRYIATVAIKCQNSKNAPHLLNSRHTLKIPHTLTSGIELADTTHEFPNVSNVANLTNLFQPRLKHLPST